MFVGSQRAIPRAQAALEQASLPYEQQQPAAMRLGSKAITDDSELEEVVTTERHRLYGACTRAGDHLLITCGDTCSEFVEDLLG